MGCRSAFNGLALMMILIAAVYSLFAKEKPSDVGLPEYVDPNEERESNDQGLKDITREKGKLYPYVHLLKQWKFDLWIVIIACSSIGRYGLLTWIPICFVAVFGFMHAGPGLGALVLLFIAGFFIYGINSLVWTFATDVGGRMFSGTVTGILDCATYIGASVQAIFFGGVLTRSGD